jgi:hypothetical protein
MRYWPCHVLAIQDADFLSWCEEMRVFRKAKVGHRHGASIDEVRRGSFPENSIKGNRTPSKRGRTHPIPGIFWKVSTTRRRAFSCSFNCSSYTDSGMSEKQADVGWRVGHAYRHFLRPAGKSLSGLRCQVRYHVARGGVKTLVWLGRY